VFIQDTHPPLYLELRAKITHIIAYVKVPIIIEATITEFLLIGFHVAEILLKIQKYIKDKTPIPARSLTNLKIV